MGTVPEGLDQDSGEQSFADSEELRGLIALGRERGYLTFEQIAATLEEVEVTKEQVTKLHAQLVDHGVDVIARMESVPITSSVAESRAKVSRKNPSSI